MDSATYRQVFSQIKKSCALSHSSFPCHNLVAQKTLLKLSKDFDSIEDENNQEQFLADFPCYKPFDYRVELSLAFLCGSCEKDFASDLVRKKLHWRKKLGNLKLPNVDKAIKCIKYLKKKEPQKLSQDLTNYIQHFQDDPEPMFQGRYNWLYSGGNLHSLAHEDNAVLVTSDYQNKFPKINILKLNNTFEEIEFKSSYEVKNASPILQISAKSKCENLFILVRQKDYANLMSTSKSCFTYPKKLWKKKTVQFKLLTSSDIRDDCERIMLSDSNHDVHVFDLETKSKLYGFSSRKSRKVDSNKDKWNHVMFGDQGVYLALRDCLCVLDIRNENLIPKLVYTPKMIETCEEISSVTQSSCDSNYLYVGTTHNVLQVDLRNLETVQRWTHLMKSPPQFLTCIKDDDKDFVVSQSEKIDERLGIVNDYVRVDEENHFLSKSLPCFLKGVNESLKLAKFNGLCLSPLVLKRFHFAVTGNYCLKNKHGDIHLYTGSSGGDVFLTKLKKSSSKEMEKNERESKILETMKAYEAHFEHFSPSKLDENSSETTYMKNLLKDLVHSKQKLDNYQRPELLWKYHETYHPQSLLMYRDVMAHKILNVWMADNSKPELEELTISSEDKVRQWIEKLGATL